MYDTLVIIGLVWFLSLIPLLLWSVSGDSYTLSTLDVMKWRLFVAGVVLSPALMLLGGWLAPESDSAWPALGRAAGIPAAFLCWGIGLLSVVPDDENNRLHRFAYAGCLSVFAMLGIGTFVVAGFALVAGDLGFGIGGIVGGLALTVFGAGLVRAVWTNRDADWSWAMDKGAKLFAYGGLFFGGSIALLGIPVAWWLRDWRFLLGSLIVGAVFLYRAGQLLNRLD